MPKRPSLMLTVLLGCDDKLLPPILVLVALLVPAQEFGHLRERKK